VVLPNSRGRDVARMQSPGYATSPPTTAQPLSARFPFASSGNMRPFGLY
jgi:hypothetical protein